MSHNILQCMFHYRVQWLQGKDDDDDNANYDDEQNNHHVSCKTPMETVCTDGTLWWIKLLLISL